MEKKQNQIDKSPESENRERFKQDEERLREKLKKCYQKYDDRKYELYDKIFDFVEKLKKEIEIEDLRDYLAFHIVIGSTPPKENYPLKFDLNGEDSFEGFIDKILKEE